MAQDVTAGANSRIVSQSMQFLFGVRFDNIDWRTALDAVQMYAAPAPGRPPRRLVFTNVHTIMLALRNPEFRRAVNYADLALPDGSGMAIAGRAFGTPIRENLNGTDFTPLVLRTAQARGWSVYLLGGKDDVNRECRRRIAEGFPGLRIAGSRAGYFSPDDTGVIIGEINAAAPDILLVGLGSPNQEIWVAQNLRSLRAGVAITVGGLFDFLAGRFRRAPWWMRRLGLEWLFRFGVDPLAKWRRVLIEVPVFMSLVALFRLLPRALHTVLLRGERFP